MSSRPPRPLPGWAEFSGSRADHDPATFPQLSGHLAPLRRVEGGQVTEPVFDRHEIEHRWRGFPKNGPAWCPGHTLS